ncbi:nuclease-related domain-containing protein [Alkalihalobacillus sp. BA299]|uniref:nuclease-related domain-containing protein n=1 Tax=Alkalihalobacillus sp. BA299 TaxID=2815938 RepID=UPI001ADBBB25|nr:nuclease-related domain-containing protein [Alkalihalobacillus sp. BA299]
MIKKNRKIPLKILKLKALLRRLAPNHPKRQYIEEELAKSIAGYNGEKAIDFHLSFLPHDYLILHDLRILDSEQRYFQIDTLIISPAFCIILEVKNISGSLIFDQTFHQLIRQSSDREEGFPDPLLQVKRQQTQLEGWLKKNKLPQIPIFSFIVISNPSTIIKGGPKDTVIHSAALPYKIKRIAEMNLQEVATLKELKKVTSFLIKQHTISNYNILEKLGIHKEDILTGVHCPLCFEIPMIKKGNNWICFHCQYHSRNAYIPSLQDYALLIGSTITNEELRSFLHISSRSIASKLLASIPLQHSGQTKGRKYKLDFPET